MLSLLLTILYVAKELRTCFYFCISSLPGWSLSYIYVYMYINIYTYISKMKICSQCFFLIRGRSTELPHFLIWFNRWVGVILKCHIGFKEENSTLDICILIIESSQNAFRCIRYQIFFNSYLLMWEHLEIKGSRILNLIPPFTCLPYLPGQITFSLKFPCLENRETTSTVVKN